MLIEYGHEGRFCEVADAVVDSSRIVTFRFRETLQVNKELKDSPWVNVRVEFLEDGTANVEYPNNTELRGATIPFYEREGESLVIDIGDSYVFHCRIQW